MRGGKALYIFAWQNLFRLHISLKITAVLGLLKPVISNESQMNLNYRYLLLISVPNLSSQKYRYCKLIVNEPKLHLSNKCFIHSPAVEQQQVVVF